LLYWIQSGGQAGGSFVYFCVTCANSHRTKFAYFDGCIFRILHFATKRFSFTEACSPAKRNFSRERLKKQSDWLATDTDVITNQSQSVFACSREKVAKWKTGPN
jgi:hypothetical protein